MVKFTEKEYDIIRGWLYATILDKTKICYSVISYVKGKIYVDHCINSYFNYLCCTDRSYEVIEYRMRNPNVICDMQNAKLILEKGNKKKMLRDIKAQKEVVFTAMYLLGYSFAEISDKFELAEIEKWINSFLVKNIGNIGMLAEMLAIDNELQVFKLALRIVRDRHQKRYFSSDLSAGFEKHRYYKEAMVLIQSMPYYQQRIVKKSPKCKSLKLKLGIKKGGHVVKVYFSI